MIQTPASASDPGGGQRGVHFFQPHRPGVGSPPPTPTPQSGPMDVSREVSPRPRACDARGAGLMEVLARECSFPPKQEMLGEVEGGV